MAKLPYFVQPVSTIAGILGIIQSIVWLVLSTMALTSYLNCSFSENYYPPNQFFSSTLHRYFFLNNECINFKSVEDLPVSSYHIYIWSAIIIAMSSVWLIVSTSLFFSVTDSNIKNANITLYFWSVVTLGISISDIALGTIFGVWFGDINSFLLEYTPAADGVTLYELDMIRLGALLLMFIALKGGALLLANLGLAGVLFYYTFKVNDALNTNEHTIHSLGPIFAFNNGKPNNNTEMWDNSNPDYDYPYDRSLGRGQLNRAFSRNEADAIPPPRRNEPKEESYGGSIDRSNSWHQQKVTNVSNNRPFSYLEQPPLARPTTKQPTSSPVPSPQPAAITPWRRREPWDNSTLPPLPAPDYSPPQNRRLKSALKSTAY